MSHPILLFLTWHERVCEVIQIRNFTINTTYFRSGHLFGKSLHCAETGVEITQVLRATIYELGIVIPWIRGHANSFPIVSTLHLTCLTLAISVIILLAQVNHSTREFGLY